MNRADWDASKIKDAHAWCKDQVRQCMFTGNKFSKIFVANTFTQEWEMEDYFKLAEEYGYMIVPLICENRHSGKSVHNVPTETVEKMKERFNIKI